MQKSVITFHAFDLKLADNYVRVPVTRGRSVTVRARLGQGVWDDAGAKLTVKDSSGGVARDFASVREIAAGGATTIRIGKDDMQAVDEIEIRLATPETDANPANCDIIVTIEDPDA